MVDSLSLDNLQANYKQLIEAEKGRLLQVKRITSRRNRRSSVLRMSGCRVSDANLHFANLDRRSFISADSSLEGHEHCAMLGKPETLPSNSKLGDKVETVAQ